MWLVMSTKPSDERECGRILVSCILLFVLVLQSWEKYFTCYLDFRFEFLFEILTNPDELEYLLKPLIRSLGFRNPFIWYICYGEILIFLHLFKLITFILLGK